MLVDSTGGCRLVQSEIIEYALGQFPVLDGTNIPDLDRQPRFDSPACKVNGVPATGWGQSILIFKSVRQTVRPIHLMAADPIRPTVCRRCLRDWEFEMNIGIANEQLLGFISPSNLHFPVFHSHNQWTLHMPFSSPKIQHRQSLSNSFHFATCIIPLRFLEERNTAAHCDSTRQMLLSNLNGRATAQQANLYFSS